MDTRRAPRPTPASDPPPPRARVRGTDRAIDREHLLEVMQEAGLTQTSLSTRSGVAQSYISQLLLGRRVFVTAPTARKLAAGLGVAMKAITVPRGQTPPPVQPATRRRGETRQERDLVERMGAGQ